MTDHAAKLPTETETDDAAADAMRHALLIILSAMTPARWSSVLASFDFRASLAPIAHWRDSMAMHVDGPQLERAQQKLAELFADSPDVAGVAMGLIVQIIELPTPPRPALLQMQAQIEGMAAAVSSQLDQPALRMLIAELQSKLERGTIH